MGLNQLKEKIGLKKIKRPGASFQKELMSRFGTASVQHCVFDHAALVNDDQF